MCIAQFLKFLQALNLVYPARHKYFLAPVKAFIALRHWLSSQIGSLEPEELCAPR